MNLDQELARAIALEKFKFDRSKELEDHKAIEARHQISFKATLDFGTMACRSALLINGAGAIALMTFIGHQDKMIAALSRALACFAVGARLGSSSDARDLPRTSLLYAKPSERIAPAKNGLRLSRLGHPVLHWKRGCICPWPDCGWHIFQSRIHGVSVKEGLGWGAWLVTALRPALRRLDKARVWISRRVGRRRLGRRRQGLHQGAGVSK
jgi:hypothetical protein